MEYSLSVVEEFILESSLVPKTIGHASRHLEHA